MKCLRLQVFMCFIPVNHQVCVSPNDLYSLIISIRRSYFGDLVTYLKKCGKISLTREERLTMYKSCYPSRTLPKETWYPRNVVLTLNFLSIYFGSEGSPFEMKS